MGTTKNTLYQATFCLEGTPQANHPRFLMPQSPLEQSATDPYRLKIKGDERSELQLLDFSLAPYSSLDYAVYRAATEAEEILGMTSQSKIVDNFHQIISDPDTLKTFLDYLKNEGIGFYAMAEDVVESGMFRNAVICGAKGDKSIMNREFFKNADKKYAEIPLFSPSRA